MLESVSEPVVSIVLPVYNAAATLTECIESIRAQNLQHFEVIVIDDGSVDASQSILRCWAEADKRVVLLRQEHRGIVAALNHGMQQARAPFIARMDADDVMHPARLQMQYEALSRDPGLDLVAAQVELFPVNKIQAGYAEYIRWQNAVLSTKDISQEIYVESPFAHPTVMFRKSVVERLGAYREGDFPEDYDLWLRLYHAGCRMKKLPVPLLRWRESDYRASRIDQRYSVEAFDRLRAHYLVQDVRLKTARPIVYWGAGRRTRKRTAWLIEKGYKPRAWIDIDGRKIGNCFAGAQVKEPEWLVRDGGRQAGDNEKPFVLSYVTNHGAKQIIAEQLAGYGYQKGVDFLQIG